MSFSDDIEIKANVIALFLSCAAWRLISARRKTFEQTA